MPAPPTPTTDSEYSAFSSSIVIIHTATIYLKQEPTASPPIMTSFHMHSLAVCLLILEIACSVSVSAFTYSIGPARSKRKALFQTSYSVNRNNKDVTEFPLSAKIEGTDEITTKQDIDFFRTEDSSGIDSIALVNNKHSSKEIEIVSDSNGDQVTSLPPPAVAITDKKTKLLHMGTLIVGTLWWYIYGSYEMLINPGNFLDIANDSPSLYTALAVYLPVSQMMTYGILWGLMNTKSLRVGQALIAACVFFCVPADTIVILFNPTGSKLATVLAFSLVTMMYGVLLAHYLREASILETANQPGESEINEHHHNHSIVEEIVKYRPPNNLQSTHMAVAFTRSFVAFTISVAALRDSVGHEGGFWLYASLFSVATHTAVEMCLTTLTPGIDLEEYPEFLSLGAILYSVHMLASTYIAHESPLGDSIWDQLTYSWLFGNAAAEFTKRIEMLVGNVDYDDKLGLRSAVGETDA